MELTEHPPTDASNKDVAAMLFQQGDTLRGKNLRRSSWLEIAEVATSQGHIQPIVWQRLRSACTRNDVLRVLRIVRRQIQKQSAGTGRRRKTKAAPQKPETTLETCADEEVDGYWNNLDPWNSCLEGYPDCQECWGSLGHEDLFFFQSRQILNKLPTQSAFDLPTSGNQDEDHSDLPTTPASSVESELAKHMSARVRRAEDPEFNARVTAAIGDRANLDVIRAAAEKEGSPEFGVCLVAFAPFWIRSPIDWDGTARILDHLFVQHDVPEFLYSEWYREDCRTKWLIWFILIAQGGSLHRARRHFAWRTPRKFQQQLNSVPPDLTPLEATAYAEIQRLGGTGTEFRRLERQHGAFLMDRTEHTDHPRYERFWEETVRWLAANREEITDTEANDILTWAYHEYTESVQRAELFSWKGRSPQAALQRALEYQDNRLSRHGVHLEWQSHGWNFEFEDSVKWSFIELTSGRELKEEGVALNHCVYCYAPRCVAGYSSIFSMRRNGERCITIDLNPVTQTVQQARGAFNRDCDEKERSTIEAWLRQVFTVPGIPAASEVDGP